MDIRFNQDDRFYMHDGFDPAPGDDEPKPDIEELLEDEQDEAEDYDEDEDEENEDDDDDPDPDEL
jgi:hypothetical protein